MSIPTKMKFRVQAFERGLSRINPLEDSRQRD